MPPSAWDPAKIKKVAEKGGKPVEVESAIALNEAKWDVVLGSNYEDMATGKIRELDVMAYQFQEVNGKTGKFRCGVEVFISCKGFPENESPVLYSISGALLPEAQSDGFLTSGKHLSNIKNIESGPPEILFDKAGIDPNRRIFGFDVYQEIQNSGTPPELKSRGDKDLFADGVDSAIKAAIYWHRFEDDNRSVAAIRLPIFILSRPWWEVPIDKGRVIGAPEQKHKGFSTTLYPIDKSSRGPRPVTYLVWAATHLNELVPALSHLYDWLFDEAEDALTQ